MTLYEFIEKRLEELGKNKNQLVQEVDITWATLGKIRNGMTPKRATLEKLAIGLVCTQGELQKCLSETPNPLRKEAERPEGQAGINVTTKVKKKAVKKKEPAPDPGEPETEPAELFTPAEPDETDDNYGFEVPEQQLRDSIEDEKSEMFIRDMAIAYYKGRLKDMCIQKLAMASGNNVTDVYTEIGYELVKELVK